MNYFNWPDISEYGLRIAVSKTSLGQSIYFVTDAAGKPVTSFEPLVAQALQSSGFDIHAGVCWSDTLSIDSLSSILVATKIIRVNSRQVIVKGIEALNTRWLIGKNHNNEDVFIDFNAVRAIFREGKYILDDGAKANPDFLRGYNEDKPDKVAVQACMAGFIQLASTKTMSMRDVFIFASSVRGQRLNKTDKIFHDIQAGIRTSIQAHIEGIYQQAGGAEAFEAATHIQENMTNILPRAVPTVPVQLIVEMLNVSNDLVASSLPEGKCVASCVEMDTALGGDIIKVQNNNGMEAPYRKFYDFQSLWSWSQSLIGLDVADDANVNEYQAKYISGSRGSNPRDVLIPRNMLVPIGSALSLLSKDHGGVDSFIIDKLNLEDGKIFEYFSGAQIDALALAIKRFDAGQGFILGDQTGFGKGRVMAGMIRYCILNGLRPVFLTEKANLFSDIIRDLGNIGSLDIVHPLVLNSDSRNGNILNPDGTSYLINSSQKIQRKDFIETGDLSQHNMLFATYSQFNGRLSKKTDALKVMMANHGAILMDESHNAAGSTSNVGKNIQDIISDSNVPVIFSSATAIKTVNNLDLYMQTMGDIPYSTKEIVEAAQYGGDKLLQVLSTMMAADGAMVRREFSIDDVVFEKVEPDDLTVKLNIEKCSSVASIVQDMMELSNECEDKFKAMFPMSERGAKHYSNFASGVYNLNRCLMLALRSDQVADEVLADIRSNKKPVIVMDHTMDSLVGSIIEHDDLQSSGGIFTLDGPVSFKSMLSRTLRNLMSFTDKGDDGKRFRTSIANEHTNALMLKIKSSIENSDLDHVRLNVFDIIKGRIHDAGFNCGEISNRKWQVALDNYGNTCIKKMQNISRSDEIHGFGDGQLDAIICSGAGSTGLSLHAGVDFNDQRQRVMHIVQPSLNVVSFIQFLGRVDRADQVCSPIVKMHTSGLIGEKRELSGLGFKLSDIMASSTANKNSKISLLIGDDVDVINTVGDKAAKEFLMTFPETAKIMGIDIAKVTRLIESGDMGPSDLIRKTLSRLFMLQHGDVEDVSSDIAEITPGIASTQAGAYEWIQASYRETIDEMNASGDNPLSINEYHWKAKTVSRTIFNGNKDDECSSVFNEPVYIREIEYETVLHPLRWDGVVSAMKSGREKEDEQREHFHGGHPYSTLNKNKDSIIRKVCHNLNRSSPIRKRTELNIKNCLMALTYIRSGRLVKFHDDQDKQSPEVVGVITRMVLPGEDELHRPGSYRIHIAVPGEDRPRILSLANLCSESRRFGVLQYSLFQCDNAQSDVCMAEMKPKFDDAIEGEITIRRCVLDGNLFAAAMNGMGKLSVFTDSTGSRNTCFMLPPHVNYDAIASHGVIERDTSVIARVFRELGADGKQIQLSNAKYGESFEVTKNILIMRKGDDYHLVIPISKAHGAKYSGDTKEARFIKHALGETKENAAFRSHTILLKHGQRKKVQVAFFSDDQLEHVLDVLVPVAGGFKLTPKMAEYLRSGTHNSEATMEITTA